jgi:hypothetical protein
MKNQNKMICSLLIILFLASIISSASAVETVQLGQTSYGYVDKIGPYGDGTEKIAVIVGVHPQEGNVRKAMIDAINSTDITFKSQIYIYRIVVTQGMDDREQSRINGENLANKYVVPDIDDTYSLAIDVHGNRGLYNKKDTSFIFAPQNDDASKKVANQIADGIAWLDYYYVSGTSPPKVTIPIAKKGIPALVLELYRNVGPQILEDKCTEFITTVDSIMSADDQTGH